MDKLTRRSFIIAASAAAAAAAGACSVPAQPTGPATEPGAAKGAGGINYTRLDIIPNRITPNFTILSGSPGVDPGHLEAAGGRMAVLAGSDGIFMVDASYAPVTGKILDVIRSFSNAPMRYLVNTHEHPDHTGGNGNIVRQGAILIGRSEVRDELSRPLPPAVGDAASGSDPARLPSVTLGRSEPLVITMNAEIISVIPFPDAHTKGDTVIHFANTDAIMIGDFYRNYGYPFVDPFNGGTFRGVLDALEQILHISGPSTRLIPGHGNVIDRTAIQPYRDMINHVSTDVHTMISQGKSLPEVLATKPTRAFDQAVPGGLDPLPGGLGTSADRFVATLYAESSKAR